MTSLSFTKGHGTKNDFVLLFDEDGDLDITPALVRFLCDRRAGIGADGVIRAVRSGALEAGRAFDSDLWFMDYWNADGSTSEMCGNGARVFGAFLEAKAGLDLSDGISFATRGGLRSVESRGGGRYAVGMGAWSLGAPGGFDSQVDAQGLSHERPAMSVDVGNPHRVVALSSDHELDALDLSIAPEVIPEPAHGANVEFVVARGVRTVDGTLRGHARMRVHERGSGETQSCGTGACAVALAVASWAGDDAPRVWDIEVPGGLVTVEIAPDHTVLEGPAVLVASGTVEIPV